jgi:hypothetical protein
MKQRVFISIENGRHPERQKNHNTKTYLFTSRGLSPLLPLFGYIRK